MSDWMLPADHPAAPKYWMHEQGGELGPAIERYLRNEMPKLGDMGLIRAYLRQWINSPVWLMNPGITNEGRLAIAALRTGVFRIRSRPDIDRWIADAVEIGIDPL